MEVFFLITTIIFDVDDTIYDQQQPFEKAISKIFPHVSSTDFNNLYIRFRFHSDESFSKSTSGEWSMKQMRTYRINEALKDLNYPAITELQGTIFQIAYKEELNQISVHKEVIKVLDFLKEKNISMGVITNGPSRHQQNKIQQLALEKWIPREHILVSGDTDFHKPQIELFDLATKQINLIPANTLYVGDSFENDMIGATNAGWQGLWFNHRSRMNRNKEIEIKAEINSFDQLFPTIKEMIQ